MKYEPLSVNYREHYIKEKRNFWELDETNFRFIIVQRFFRTWRKVVSVIRIPWLYPRVWKCVEHKQIIDQLSKRHEFASNQWSNKLNEYEEIEKIFIFIKEQFLWPNIFFVPDDPLSCLLMSPDVNDIYWFAEDINDFYDKEVISVKELFKMIDENKNIVELINLLHSRVAT